MIFSAILALQVATAPSATPLIPACPWIEGAIEARAHRIGLDFHGFKAVGTGVIRGSYEAEIRLEIRKRGTRDGVKRFAVRLDVSTPFALRMQGMASATPPPEGGPVHGVHGRLDVLRADGERLTTLEMVGTVDTRDRSLRVTYVGECGMAAPTESGAGAGA